MFRRLRRANICVRGMYFVAGRTMADGLLASCQGLQNFSVPAASLSLLRSSLLAGCTMPCSLRGAQNFSVPAAIQSPRLVASRVHDALLASRRAEFLGACGRPICVSRNFRFLAGRTMACSLRDALFEVFEACGGPVYVAMDFSC